MHHRHAGDLADPFGGVVAQERGQLLERAHPRPILEGVALGLVAEAAVPDLLQVLDPSTKHDVLVDEGLVDLPLRHDQVQDAVGQRQIGARGAFNWGFYPSRGKFPHPLRPPRQKPRGWSAAR